MRPFRIAQSGLRDAILAFPHDPEKPEIAVLFIAYSDG
jgi:hypothetical protein